MTVTLTDKSPASYMAAARKIRQEAPAGLRPIKVGVLATFTVEPIAPYWIVEAAQRGCAVDVHFGPYGQLEMPVLEPNSPFRRFDAEVVVVAARLEDLAPDLVWEFLGKTREQVDLGVRAVITRIQGLVEAIRSHSRAPILICNFAEPLFAVAGLAEPGLERSQRSVIAELNSALGTLSRTSTDTHIIDFAGCVSVVGTEAWTDLRMLYRARMPLGARAQVAFATLLARTVRALVTPARKCLVLDLDNTLWGGVIGEDGAGGIKLGEDHPGNVFKAFHRAVLALRDRGVILAIASKNNLADAMAVFEEHPDCLLRPQHFAAMEIHWEDKATSLRRIAQTLSIGTDALVFFDDNPVEREWVRTQMPEVAVIDVPDSPVAYVPALWNSEWFDALTISVEDRHRADMYVQEQARAGLHARHASVEEFLQDLAITVSIGAVGPETLPRVSQLIGKTNQFNLTTRRYTSAALEQMMADGAITLWLRARDRFGDNGLVGVALAVPADGQDRAVWRIDVLLMSCRVIGRRIETALLSELSRRVRRAGGRRLVGEFIPTDRNSMAASVYPDHGFVPADDAGRTWELALSEAAVPRPGFVTVHIADEEGQA